ncbi:MAG TPA: hypothetical protein PLP88_11350 [Bacteroidales bacterium]|nr:hypothetical protein [Bacteroidales bacterium]
MKDKKVSQSLYLVISLIVAGALMRLIPHWPNFTPIAAIALFGGTYIRRKELAIVIPLAALFLSDLLLGFHSTMIAVYASFVLIATLGFLVRRNPSVINITGFSLASSVLFFLITNFAVWYSGLVPYSRDAAGLITAYVAGLPFLWNGMLGDLFYNGLLFGALYLINNRISLPEKA